MNDFLQLKNEQDVKDFKIFDNVEIIVDPELEDESTIDINNYLNKYILQCRICGNMFPSDEMLDNDTECPVCNETSNDGFIFKGKLKNKNKEDNVSDKEIDAINKLSIDDADIQNNFDENNKDINL